MSRYKENCLDNAMEWENISRGRKERIRLLEIEVLDLKLQLKIALEHLAKKTV